MTKRILAIFCLLAALTLPAIAATKSHHSRHAASGARRGRASRKSVRPSTRRRSKSPAARKRAGNTRAARARRHKSVKR